MLDEAQRAKQEESERYVKEVIYQGGEIVATRQLPSGDVVDFIARDTLPALPYSLPPLPWTPEDLALPPGVELAVSEIEQIPDLLALAATATPFHRPTFWPYILGESDATSIEDYLARHQIGGQPSGPERLYAGLRSVVPNRGVSGFMNQFRPAVEPGAFSLIEFAVSCPAEGPAQEVVGVAISVDKVNPFGKNHRALTDGEPRLHIEYAHVEDGRIKYDWDGADGAFRPNPLRHRVHPGQKVPVSVPGGTQVEHLIAIFQVPTGDWWIAYQHELLGYFPAGRFTMLNGGACVVNWYGEIARMKPASGRRPPRAEMGSGRFAEAGAGLAASVRSPRYYDLLWFGGVPSDGAMQPSRTSCYTRTALDNDIFFLGGHGDEDRGCTWPSP